MATTASFGYWVRRQRLALDLTQAALAAQVGCATITIRKIEREERRPSRQMAEQLATCLAIPAADRETFIQCGLGQLPVDALPLPTEPQPQPAGAAGPSLPPFLTMPEEEAGDNGPTRFVAREPELAQLDGHLAAALEGNGRVVFITGDSGRGKTSLLAEFARRAQAGQPDLIVAGGAGSTYANIGDPYLPFRELLSLLTGDVEARLAARSITREQALRLWQLAPTALPLLLAHGPHLLDIFVASKPLLSRAKTAVPERTILAQLQEIIERRPTSLEQSGLFSEYTDFLRHLSQKRPLLLTLDDLHWADEASLSLLFHLGRRMSGSRLLIVGAYRPEELVQYHDERHHPLAKVVAELQRLFGNILINLAGDDERNGRRFIDALLDNQPNRLDESFRQALLQQTGGHPLFTVELLSELQRSGSLIQDETGRWLESSVVAWATLPTRVEAVIAQRLDRLDGDLQQILRIASVEGERFTVEVVAQVAGLEPAELVERFSRELVKQHSLLTPQGIQQLENEGQMLSFYRFRHHLFQAYLYQSLDKIQRVYQHKAVGTALETVYGAQTGEIAAHLARHFEIAGHTAKAIAYLQQAGERAMRLSAYDEAVESLHRGLRLCNSLPETAQRVQLEVALLLLLGEALRKAGQIEESLATFQRAGGLARTHNLPEALGEAALGYEESRWRFNLPAGPAASLLQESLDKLGQVETLLTVRLWVNLVRTRMATSSPEQFATMTYKALAMARRLNDPVSLYDALYLIVRGDRRPEMSTERLKMMAEMRQLAQCLDSRENIYDTYGFRLQEFLEIGDMAALQADYEIVTSLTHKAQQPFYNYYPATMRVLLTLFDGRFAEAEKAAQDALEIGRQMRVENVDGVYGMQMFSIRREQGRLIEMAPLIRLLPRQTEMTAWRPGLALLYRELDMRPEAAQEFEALAAADYAALPRDAMWPTTLTYLAEVCAYLDDRERAAMLYDYLLPYDGRAVVVGFLAVCYGAAAHYLGMLAATLKRWPEAEAHFESALAMNERMGAQPWLAHTRFQYGLMLLARNQKHDRDKATTLLAQARATAQELGMKTLVAKIKSVQPDNYATAQQHRRQHTHDAPADKQK
jgi:transcriptional regulator with XRE-family HTH domain/tetratricopeptide (TPR) repeat protein